MVHFEGTLYCNVCFEDGDCKFVDYTTEQSITLVKAGTILNVCGFVKI